MVILTRFRLFFFRSHLILSFLPHKYSIFIPRSFAKELFKPTQKFRVPRKRERKGKSQEPSPKGGGCFLFLFSQITQINADRFLRKFAESARDVLGWRSFLACHKYETFIHCHLVWYRQNRERKNNFSKQGTRSCALCIQHPL